MGLLVATERLIILEECVYALILVNLCLSVEASDTRYIVESSKENNKQSN